MVRFSWLVIALSATRIASADPHDECDRIKAEAHSDAVVLYGPEVSVDAAHVPAVTNVSDPAATPSNGLQVRVSATYSFTDMLRGRAIERVASATCTQLTAGEQLERVLAIGPRWGELESAKAELAYLEEHAAELDALVQNAQDRFAAQRTTAVEVDELRSRRNAIALRVVDRKEAIAMFEEADSKLPDLNKALDTYRSASLDVDRGHADVRDMQAWRFDVRGGAAGSDRADWFAVVEVGYSIGGLWQGDADRKAIAAHKAAMQHDDHDAGVRLEQMRATMKRSATAIDAEVASIDAQLEILHTDQARIADMDSARSMRDRYAVEIIELAARRAAAIALRDARRTLVGDKP